jgi:1,4-dihydroxy-2-naphthoyl-CoA hydrolase
MQPGEGAIDPESGEQKTNLELEAAAVSPQLKPEVCGMELDGERRPEQKPEVLTSGHEHDPHTSRDPADWLELRRVVRFGDTDAAGVMHFHQLLRWCHEAWEESLERFGIPAAEIFPTPSAMPARALPVVHCDADYRRPLVCGAPLSIRLEPQRLEPSSFAVAYHFTSEGREVARARLRHVAIDPALRQRQVLPEAIERWLQASTTAASSASAALVEPAPG